MVLVKQEFINDWLNKLKEYWFNKDIDKAVGLFRNSIYETIYNFGRNKSRMATC